MNMSRPAYVLNNSAPGADVLGTTAAALAASAIVFEATDSSYAERLTDTAVALYRWVPVPTPLLPAKLVSSCQLNTRQHGSRLSAPLRHRIIISGAEGILAAHSRFPPGICSETAVDPRVHITIPNVLFFSV